MIIVNLCHCGVFNPQWRRIRSSSSWAELVWAGLALVKRNGPARWLQPPACNLTASTHCRLFSLRTRLLWHTWRNCSLHSGTTFFDFCMVKSALIVVCRSARDAFYSSLMPPRTAVEVVSWSSCLPEWLDLKKRTREYFLKLVFIHHRRIW